jgi:hypothetical protein
MVDAPGLLLKILLISLRCDTVHHVETYIYRSISISNNYKKNLKFFILINGMNLKEIFYRSTERKERK